MVLMNAGKMARSQNAIINRTNVCGGPKKAGIGKGIGNAQNSFILTAMRRASSSIPKKCVVFL